MPATVASGPADNGPADSRPAAWVAGAPVPASDIDAYLDRLRTGPRAALLPVAGSAEGRQLRRWVTQVVVTVRLLESAAAELGPLARCGAAPSTASVVPDRQAALELGTVVAHVLATNGDARAVFAEVTRTTRASAQDVEDYYARNLDEFTTGGEPRALPDVAEEVADRLTAALRRRCFVDWLDRRRAVAVRLAPGHEHPGDPRQPDATHRH